MRGPLPPVAPKIQEGEALPVGASQAKPVPAAPLIESDPTLPTGTAPPVRESNPPPDENKGE